MKQEIVTTHTPDFEKRLSKPLPVMPLQSQSLVSWDDTFHNHFNKLLNNWLTNINIPVKPWFNVLHTIALDLFQKSLLSKAKDNKNEIYLQTISTNTPIESKFLVNVYHGYIAHAGIYCYLYEIPLLIMDFKNAYF